MKTVFVVFLLSSLIMVLLFTSLPVSLAAEKTNAVDIQISSGNDDCTFFWNGKSWDQDGLEYRGLYTGYVDDSDSKEGVALRWASVSGNQVFYSFADRVILNAAATDGWSFTGWSSDDIIIFTPRTRNYF